MSTRATVEAYFDALRAKQGWDALFADDIAFSSMTSPVRTLTGRAALVEGTKRFYGSIVSFELRGLIVAGDRACALTRYQLRGPAGPFVSDVAEIFTVKAGKLASFDIYFDSAPFPK